MSDGGVKLCSLDVYGLHGCCDLSANFNSDVTFLYGMNGCGKTTLLNITEAIVTGQLYRLFSYKFCKIEFKYFDGSGEDAKEISICSGEPMIVTFNEQSYEFCKIDGEQDAYFQHYGFMKEIRSIFSCVYFPFSCNDLVGTTASSGIDSPDIFERTEALVREKCSEVDKESLKLFLGAVTDFMEYGKEILIDLNDGQLYFETFYCSEPISVKHLSFGEKRVITFFADLVFKAQGNSAVFIVDEPEQSLHLALQKMFVSKILEVNDKVQLIFATHSPELIGYRGNKVCKAEMMGQGEKTKKWYRVNSFCPGCGEEHSYYNILLTKEEQKKLDDFYVENKGKSFMEIVFGEPPLVVSRHFKCPMCKMRFAKGVAVYKENALDYKDASHIPMGSVSVF